MQNKSALIIATEGINTTLLYNKVAEHFELKKVLIEPHESKVTILKRRFKKLGFTQTFGQVLFMLLVLPFIKKKKNRIQQIINSFELNSTAIPETIIQRIPSVHSEELIRYLKANPVDYIFINGTRIIRSAVLEAVTSPIINIHIGVTPQYRGVHGGFWAVKEKQMHLFGTTLHFVDTGIDTGAIIDQIILHPHKDDNFKTYPILQYCGGLSLLAKNNAAFQTGSVIGQEQRDVGSKLHYHPTIWGYFCKERG